MIWFILFIMAIVGFSHIVVESELFKEPKSKLLELSEYLNKQLENQQSRTISVFKKVVDKIYYMLNCYQCSGFWCGLWVSMIILLTNFLPNDLSLRQVALVSLLGGFVGSFCSMVSFYLIFKLEQWAAQK